MELRRQLRTFESTRCGGFDNVENRILQRGGKYSALPPALGIGPGRSGSGSSSRLRSFFGYRSAGIGSSLYASSRERALSLPPREKSRGDRVHGGGYHRSRSLVRSLRA